MARIANKFKQKREGHIFCIRRLNFFREENLKFEFSLTALLKTKSIKEKEIQRVLNEAINKKNRHLEEEKLLEEEFAACCSDYKELCSGCRITAEEMAMYHNYMKKIKESLVVVHEGIEEIKKLETQIREKLMKITKEKKVLEKLQEKEYNKYIEDLRHREAKELDEASIRTFNHNHKNAQN